MILQSGSCEPLKAATHASLGLLAGACLMYNVAAWLLRREHHLRNNALFYGAIVAVEAYQVKRHCRS